MDDLEDRMVRWKLFEARYGPIAPSFDAEEALEEKAWKEFVRLFRHVPCDSYRPQGMGQR